MGLLTTMNQNQNLFLPLETKDNFRKPLTEAVKPESLEKASAPAVTGNRQI